MDALNARTDALFARLRGPATLRARMLRVVVVRASAFTVLAGALLLGHAVTLDPSSATLDATPLTVPTWSPQERAAEPDCVPAADWKAGTPASAVVVHRFNDGATVRLPFMDAWTLNKNASDADDVWVLGICP